MVGGWSRRLIVYMHHLGGSSEAGMDLYQSLKIMGRSGTTWKPPPWMEIEAIHIVDGDSRNRLLNQMTADAAGKPVTAVPAEATVKGNAIMQIITLGEIGSLSEARQMIAQMGELEHYQPGDTGVCPERSNSKLKEHPLEDPQ